MEQFGWDDAEDIAIALFEKMPNVNPLTVRLQICMIGFVNLKVSMMMQ